MKKTLLLTGMACIISCQANAMDIKPYIGADMGASHAELQGLLDGFDDNFAVAGINVGAKFNNYFGLEVSAQSSSEAETYDLDLSYSSINLDALGYIPLNKNLELIGSVGAGYYTFDLGTDIGDGYDCIFKQMNLLLGQVSDCSITLMKSGQCVESPDMRLLTVMRLIL